MSEGANHFRTRIRLRVVKAILLACVSIPVLFLVPSQSVAQSIYYGMFNGGTIYRDNFVDPMPVLSGTFALGTLPGGNTYNFAGKTREQILADFRKIPAWYVDRYSPGQFYAESPPQYEDGSFVPASTHLFVFFSTGASLTQGAWCVVTGSYYDGSYGWLSPNLADPLFAFTWVDLSLPGNRICAGTPGWRYRRGGKVADESWFDDLGLLGPYGNFDLEGAATKSPFDAATATNWAAGGTVWTLDESTSHDGVDSVKGRTTDNQSSYREYRVSGPAVVEFWWKVSSEQGFDFFSFAVNGVVQDRISGEVDWTYRALTLGSGEHTLRWTYAKDASDAVGQDAGWLDDFALYPADPVLRIREGNVLLEATATVDFGTVDLQTEGPSRSLNFANEGYVPIEAQLTLPDGSAFAFEGSSSSYELYLGKGESLDVPIYLNTSSAGSKSGQLAISVTGAASPPPSVTLTGYVRGGLPIVTTWPTATSITYGQALSSSILAGGLADRPGAFGWATPASIPKAGTNTASVVFTPEDSTNYNSVSSDVTLVVAKAMPAVSNWPSASSIAYGQALSNSVLSGGSANVPGLFSWSVPAFGPTVGATAYSVIFTPTDSANYDAVSSEVIVEVVKGTPVVASWPVASLIGYGQALSNSTLTGGAADVAGTFSWLTPTVFPPVGTHSYGVVFTPSDEQGYETVSSDLVVTVGKGTPVVGIWPTASPIFEGQALSNSVLAGGSADVPGTFFWAAPATVPEPGTNALSVTFTPADLDSFNPTTSNVVLTVVPLGGAITVSSAGGGIAHEQTTPLDFGLAPFEVEFTIANDGNAADLDIANVQVSGNFAITKPPSASVAPGSSTTFKVASLDAGSGVQLGVVSIECNDLDTPVFTFPVRSKVFFGTGNPDSGGTGTSGTGGAVGWDFAQTGLPDLSVGQALKTGTTPDGGASVLQGVFDGPGMLTWKWKVATQQGFDWLTCEVDGVEVAGISTKSEKWQGQSIRVPAGATVRWIYRKDATGTVGVDAGYLTALDFEKFDGEPADYEQWAKDHGSPAPDAKDPKSGLPYVFGWLGGWDPAVGPNTNHYRAVREDGVFKYRFPVSKTSTGSARVEFTTDLRFPVQTNSWSVRGLEQTVLPGDGDHAVMEVTAPSPTRGYFRLIYSP